MRLLLFTILASPALLFLPLSAGAQTEEDTISYSYGPVTVLGTRVAESWIEVPLSLTFIRPADLRTVKGYGLDEVLTYVPGVLSQSRFGNQDVRLIIRGFGARGAGERSNSGTTRGIRILNNGFPETEPDGRTSLDLLDISAAGGIEVMRSNASSLYGNAAGGIINVSSNTTFAAPFTEYRQTFGSFGFHKEHLMGGAMLGDGRMYFSLGNTTSDGWREHSNSSQFLVSTGIVSHLGERTNVGLHLVGTSNIFRIPGALTKPQYDSLASQSDSIFIARDERRNNKLGRIGVTADHQLDDNNTISGTAFVEPKYLERSERNTYRNFTRYHIGGSGQYKHTASFSPSVMNTFLVGVDEAYQDGAVLFYTLSPDGGRDLPLKDNKREGANNIGAFLQDEIGFGSDWSVLLGLRYDNVTYYSESYVDLNLHDTKSFERMTPKAGVTYRFTPTHSVYASLGGGLEVPAGNETDPASTFGEDTVYAINPLLDAMRSTTVEVGTKQIVSIGGESPSAYLTYDVAAYWLEVTDDIIPYRNGRFYFTAGKTERMGIEAGGEINFTMGLTGNAAVTFSHNEYKDYTVDSVHYGNPGKIADYSGNKVVGVPDIFFTVGLKYAPKGLMGAYIGVNVQNVGEYYADDANTILIPSFTILNGIIGIDKLDLGGSGLYISAFAGLNNITDLKYIGSAWLNPDVVNGEPIYIEPGLPRNFVGNISLGLNM